MSRARHMTIDRMTAAWSEHELFEQERTPE
jgi:hypothetical protein